MLKEGDMGLLYYYPNRPTLVPPDPKNPLNPQSDYINSLEASNKYVAGLKWNGDNCQIFTDDMSFWNRQKARLKYVPIPEVRAELERFPKGCILNAELMHNKTKTMKNTFIVHCLMAYKNKPLIGRSWGDSRKILETFKYGSHVRLEELHKEGFWKLFQWACESGGELIEGLVLKNPAGLLKLSATPLDDVSWMLKIRKPSKKYSF